MAVEAIAGPQGVFEPLAIPAVVFTDPEIAWCGLTEAEAQAAGDRRRSREVPVGRLGSRHHARPAGRPDQLILEPKTGRVLGVGIAGSARAS